MGQELRKEVVVAIVVVAATLAVFLGLRYMNAAEGETGNVNSVVTEIQNRNPKGVPEVSPEDAYGDTIMMGGGGR